MGSTTLITNAVLVNEDHVFEADLLIEDGRIERIDGDLHAPAGARVLDARGRHLLPGMIDDQVHFREPGLTHKGDIHSESRAAVAGGVTSFLDMPNTRPPTVSAEELDHKLGIASRNAAANYGFYFGATNDNIDAVRALDPARVCGLKVFMGASTGNMLVDDERTLAKIFRDAPVVIATHCESTPMIEENLARALQRWGPQIPVTEHPKIRSPEACYASTQKAVSLAKENHAQLHVLHLSTGRELELFEPGPMEKKTITAETCIHFLHFTDADYPAHGNRIKCNPAIKTEGDRQALIQGLNDGRIDILATDHAPHTIEEKAERDYRKAPAGLPLVQDVLLGCLELVGDESLDLADVVRKTSHHPAMRFSIRDRGFLREGFWADLVLVDLHANTDITSERVLSRCGWSPFEGRTFHSRILATWVNGELAFDGKNVREHGAARALEYTPRNRA